MAPLPARDELEALAADLPRLWNASTTSDKDRKRLLRTLIADVTLTSQVPQVGNQVRIGIRWRSGATDEIVATRPAPYRSATSGQVLELIKRLVGHSDQEIAAELAAAGLCTGSGQPFDVTAVRWARHVHRIPSAHADTAPGELTIPQVAARLQVGVSAIYHWVQAGRLLPSRRTASGRHRIMFSAEIEQACRQMIAGSARVHSQTQRTLVGGAV